MKLAVFCVLAISVCGLTAMLIQGCKRGQTADNLPPVEPATSVATDTNLSPTMVSTGAPPAEVSTSAPPAAYVAPVVPPVAPEPTTSEYVIVKGDTLAKIAKAHGVKLKALEDANPNIKPTKLKVGDKLTIPAGGTVAPAATGASSATGLTSSTGGGETYTVKSGDTLTKIAKSHGTTVKAIEAANNLSTTKIKVGQTLKLPAKAEAAAPVVAPVEAPAPAVAPVAPAPAGTPTGR